jgi:acetyl-CoA carboxylase biotin carboxyl carrier protein
MTTEHEVLCPMPGTFYRRSSPDAPPYREGGDVVDEGDVIGLVEVMKQFSEVTADCSGTLVRFLIDDQSAVEAGAPVALIRKP